jgi:carbon-monoxide dehydrogenase medium subunit
MSNLPKLAYCRPRHADKALDALARPSACIYAGGTDLLVALTARQARVRSIRELVDIKSLEEAKGISEKNGRLRVGALVTAAELASDDLIRREAPVLAEAAWLTSSPALRRRGTVGGNITTPRSAADVATALLALDATVEWLDRRGVHESPLSEFMAAQMEKWPTARMALAVTFPKSPRSAFEKMGRRVGFSTSIVAVALAVVEDGVSLALGGMSERPVLSKEIAGAVTRGGAIGPALSHECRPPADGLATSAYRSRIAATLIERALERTGRP